MHWKNYEQQRSQDLKVDRRTLCKRTYILSLFTLPISSINTCISCLNAATSGSTEDFAVSRISVCFNMSDILSVTEKPMVKLCNTSKMADFDSICKQLDAVVINFFEALRELEDLRKRLNHNTSEVSLYLINMFSDSL